jgi:hypothetical protein
MFDGDLHVDFQGLIESIVAAEAPCIDHFESGISDGVLVRSCARILDAGQEEEVESCARLTLRQESIVNVETRRFRSFGCGRCGVWEEQNPDPEENRSAEGPGPICVTSHNGCRLRIAKVSSGDRQLFVIAS